MSGRGLATLLIVAGTAAACSDGAIAPFAHLDEDANGRISREEAERDRVLRGRFTEADADRDGELTAREYLAAATR